MSTFAENYAEYMQSTVPEGDPFGFDVDVVAGIEPVLSFLYGSWWNVQANGLDLIPATGPALIVGNSGSVLPWSGLMLLYALMSKEGNPRRLRIMMDMDWIGDERIHRNLLAIGFVPWAADHAKRLFAENELVMVFPEGAAGFAKPFSERYRLKEFDWTVLMPALEERVPVVPVATLGVEESLPVFANLDKLARFLGLPALPVTPFFPLLPFPSNLLSLPGRWKMNVLKTSDYPIAPSRHELEEAARNHARLVEGQLQAELNRMLRLRLKGSG